MIIKSVLISFANRQCDSTGEMRCSHLAIAEEIHLTERGKKANLVDSLERELEPTIKEW
jgi:hypothetical protein